MKNKLVFGVGINDAEYVTQKFKKYKEGGKTRNKLIWICPFYKTWKSMLGRCYYYTNPTYAGAIVCDQWLTFSNFKAWMENQQWLGKVLDKDLILDNNKTYSPETCLFITTHVNSFMTEKRSNKGEYPTGVCFNKWHGKFVAYCRGFNDNGENKNLHLGFFNSSEQAELAYKKEKFRQACLLESIVDDPAVLNLLKIKYNPNTGSFYEE